MSLPRQDRGHSAPPPAEIVGLNPVVIGVYIMLRCQDCDQTFESYQPTLACVALGRHTCPQCQAVYEVRPDDFQAALDRYLPPLSLEEMTDLTAEATRLAENWYRVGPVARLLTYKGLNLGEPTERALVSFIAHGLYAAYTRRKAGG
ncbi:MAG: hypothetical protein AB1491_01985 [Thermodesulfobacteriota bacterium]